MANKLQKKNFEGRPHFVVETVMARVMVMNEIYYPAEVLEKSVPLWNATPVVINHPRLFKVGVNGEGAELPVSARDPKVFDEFRIGIIWKTVFDVATQKLKGEVYIDVRRVEEVNKAIAIAIENKASIEVSTGVGVEFEKNSAGVDRGKEYTARVKNILPDHLAILPNEIGACSVADGCGLFQNRALLKQDQRDEDILQPVNIGGGIKDGRWW